METYTMKLDEDVFEKVVSGTKNIELRLLDDKRRKLKKGDTIIFSKSSNKQDTIHVEIVGLHTDKDFSSIIDLFPITSFGYESKNDLLSRLYAIYTKEDEQKYGVIAIEIKLI